MNSSERLEPGGPLVELASRLSRDTVLYLSATAVTFVLSLVQVAVLTRYMPLEQFGELALLIVFTAMLTIIYNLGTLEGILTTIFGAGEDGGDGDARPVAQAGETAPLLGTALLSTALVASLGTAAVVLAAEPLSELITGGPDGETAVVLAAISGAIGSLWRLVINVPRCERRPVTFVVLSALRPILVVGLSVTLVVSGGEIEAVLAATAAGNALAVAAGLAATWHSYDLVLDRDNIRRIVRRGILFVPLTISVWIVQTGDLYLVSAFVSDADIARYRVASRLAAGVAYFVSALLMAQAPLLQTPLHAAAMRPRGQTATLGAFTTYFFVAALWVILALVVLSDVLIRVAPASYSSAAPLIPLIGLGFTTYGLFTLINRGAPFRRKRVRYVQLAVLAAAIFLTVSLLLLPHIGSYAAPAGQIAGFAVAAVIMLVLANRQSNAHMFETRQLLKVLGVGAVCLGLAPTLGALLDDWKLGLDIGILVLYPVLVVAIGIVPFRYVRGFGLYLSRLRRRRRTSRRELAASLAGVRGDRRLILSALIVERRSVDETARELNMPKREVLARAVEAIREIAGLPEGNTESDARIGSFLFYAGPRADRSLAGRRLWQEGFDPAELHRLDKTLGQLKRAGDGALHGPRPLTPISSFHDHAGGRV